MKLKAAFMNWESDIREINGAKLQIRSHGAGPPVVALHGDELCKTIPPFEVILAKDCHVVVPSLPGMNESDLPGWVDNVDDLAYWGLDFIEQLGLGKVDLVGHGFGGWVAAEMAVRSTADIRRLILIDSFGIKVSGPTVRDVQDLYVLTAAEVAELAWHDPARATMLSWPGAQGVSEEELLVLLRNRQSVMSFGWSPFMHNPKLLRRLHRANVPVNWYGAQVTVWCCPSTAALSRVRFQARLLTSSPLPGTTRTGSNRRHWLAWSPHS